jgi:hypothetical protein
MGRQVRFHALREDLQEFLTYARAQGQVIVTVMDSDRPAIEPVRDPPHCAEVMMLWNQNLIPALQRKLVRRDVGPDYYRVPYALPVLELSPSRRASWNGQAALLGGRLYGFSFEGASEAYAMWYESLSRWIRSHFARTPVTQLQGYIGPATLEWFHQGGILLPWPEPPATPRWEAFVAAQQALRSGSK